MSITVANTDIVCRWADLLQAILGNLNKSFCQEMARMVSHYDLTSIPVVDSMGCILGIVTVDDVIDVFVEEFSEDYMKMAGSDAHELENKRPIQVARLRLPWIMITMFIELFAGFVIHFYDQTLTKYILLASFMPIISAISGNTGLQSAAISIRGLSAGVVQLSHWQIAVVRQLITTVILAGACALVLGTIGFIWSGDWVFGFVIFLGMFASVNIAGIVGTVVPLISKRLGFDPALTAGPFETAFQDVVGITIFLSLATLLLGWLGCDAVEAKHASPLLGTLHSKATGLARVGLRTPAEGQ